MQNDLELVAKLLELISSDDHERLCQGREYSCTCGYDERKDAALAEAAATIERLTAEVAAADLRTGAASKVALELGAQRDRLKEAAGTYFERYCQDEADDVEHCVCGEQQHQDAIALCQALKDTP